MKVLLKRIAKKPVYTIGKWYINGEHFCETIEDTDRGLDQSMTLAMIASRKVHGKTAIPTGKYILDMSQPSPKYREKAKKDAYFKKYCEHMPRILNVKGYSGILVHPGTDEKDTEGCPIVGQNKIVGKVVNSRATFDKLWEQLYAAYLRKETITIEIV